MSPWPDQFAKCGAARTLFFVGLLTVCAPGLPTMRWLTERGCDSAAVACAAEGLDDEPADEAAGEPAERPEIPARAARPVELPIEYFPRPTKIEAKIIAALDAPISVEFTDIPLEDCFVPLRKFHNINIWLDRAAIADRGVALDQPVTLKLAGVRLRSVLKLLLEPMQLTWVIEDDVLKITTTPCNENMITRVYPVHDLYDGRVICEDAPPDKPVRGGPRGESERGDLETAIVRTIHPDSWDGNKGSPSMTYVSGSGSLVIHQTRDAHQQILELLRNLREAKHGVGPAPAEEGSAPIGWKLRGLKRDETYSLVGIMDLDGDGIDDSSRLRRLIRAIGGRIDNEVDERGFLRVDGKFPDDAKPHITARTKFVVIGAIPEIAELSDPDEIQTSLKIAGLYKDIEGQARARGVRIVRLDDFLQYIGYGPQRRR
jgi:hypothetical protein